MYFIFYHNYTADGCKKVGDFKDALSSDIEVSVFSATSKSVILRWTRVYGASSYKVIAAPQNSPGNPVGYAVFGPHRVMGTINSLSPNIMYTFTVAALDNAQEILNIGTIDSSSEVTL
ncbi:hypothetical protein JOQ06_005457 [Pogonophryne albipinna]|uniref:Fibronectin type-III domain-containing protein n=1 Tax=Pogonophryne albipinna TaxID=1090488 RepID=A0AAD6BDW3_9TELE|nr:hypothetical protein JOQ06_005457 [Pogonophryne albipinna]